MFMKLEIYIKEGKYIVCLEIICCGKNWAYNEEVSERQLDEKLRNSHSSQNSITFIKPSRVRLEELLAL
jgi:type IV secretory pathway VirB9-like protein